MQGFRPEGRPGECLRNVPPLRVQNSGRSAEGSLRTRIPRISVSNFSSASAPLRNENPRERKMIHSVDCHHEEGTAHDRSFVAGGLASQAVSVPAQVQERTAMTSRPARPEDLKSPACTGISLGTLSRRGRRRHRPLEQRGIPRRPRQPRPRAGGPAEAGLLRNPNLSLPISRGPPKPSSPTHSFPSRRSGSGRGARGGPGQSGGSLQGCSARPGPGARRKAGVAELALAQQRSALELDTANLKDRIAG